jgi:hypothetical protein
MFQWKNASSGDLKRFHVIEEMLSEHPKLLEFLFKPEKAELNLSPNTFKKCIGHLSRGERILATTALDIWSGTNETKLLDLTSLDSNSCKKVIFAIFKF